MAAETGATSDGCLTDEVKQRLFGSATNEESSSFESTSKRDNTEANNDAAK